MSQVHFINFYLFILSWKSSMITKNSVVKIQNLIVNHESRSVKLITVIIIKQYFLPGSFESLWWFGDWCILATTFKRCKLIALKMSTRVKGFGWLGPSITHNSLQWFSTCLSYVNGKYQIYFSLTNCECRIFLVLAFSYILS